MKAILLTAGEGTRIRPLSASRPKPMLPSPTGPLAAHTADAAIDAGADEIVLVVGYEGETVREYFGEEYRGVPVSYAVQEAQTGTADAVDAAREHIDGPFAVLNGTTSTILPPSIGCSTRVRRSAPPEVSDPATTAS